MSGIKRLALAQVQNKKGDMKAFQAAYKNDDSVQKGYPAKKAKK